MKGTENLGGIIIGGVIAGVTLGVGYALSQKLMNKISKPKAEEVIVTTRPMEVASEMSSLTGVNLIKNENWSNAWGSTVRKIGKVPCQLPSYNSTVMANSAAACTGAGGKVLRS